MDTPNENYENDTFLADWLAGNLSDEQLKLLVSADDFAAYQKLRESIGSYQVSNPDMEKNYEAISRKFKSKYTTESKKAIPLYRYAAIAATLLLLVGLYNVFVFSNSIATGYGKTALVRLNDGSRVTLNAKSEVSYPALFQCNRTIKLHGEAFFEVAKGNTFTVKTTQGNVTVLGTKFNVISREDFFEIICFEGKVKVVSNHKTTILTAGKAIRFYEGQSETWTATNESRPLWIAGESGFKKAPLFLVLSQLQKQFGYSVQYPRELRHVKFTGSFSNRDLDTALQSICLPLNLKYKETKDRKILLSE